jgi:hypothetical protein
LNESSPRRPGDAVTPGQEVTTSVIRSLGLCPVPMPRPRVRAKTRLGAVLRVGFAGLQLFEPPHPLFLVRDASPQEAD